MIFHCEIIPLFICSFPSWWMGFPGGASGKESTCQCRRHEMQVRSLGQEDPLEEGMATHSSILAWRIPGTGKAGRLQSVGLQRVGNDWSDVAHTQHARPKWHYCIYCNIYSSTIQDSTNLETTHPSAREWTDKQWNNLTVKYHIVIKIY